VLELPRRQLALYAAGLVVVALLGARYLARSEPAPAPAPAAPLKVSAAGEGGGGHATVHVAGAVRRPGVYRMRDGERVDDAVRRAGGPTPRADLGAVNLAAKVQDGRQVLVPERARAAAGSGPAPAAGAAGAGAGAGAASGPLNLNSASLEQLDGLDGVGPATAQAILDHRDEHDGFGSVDELDQVPGIGEKRLASLREQVTV